MRVLNSITHTPKTSIMSLESYKDELERAIKFGKVNGQRATVDNLVLLKNESGKKACETDELLGQAKAWCAKNAPTPPSNIVPSHHDGGW